MQVHIASPAVIRCKMEDRVHTVHSGAGDARFAQVSVDKINLAATQDSSNVVQMPAGQIIDNADVRSAVEKPVGECGADERGTAGNQDALAAPKSLCRHDDALSSIVFIKRTISSRLL